MNTAIIWILVTVSTGAYNGGNLTVVDRFPTAETCAFALANLPSGRYDAKCVSAKVIRQ